MAIDIGRLVMLRRATASDIPAIVAFLRLHAEIAMFPLNNLLVHGLAEQSAAERAMCVLLVGDGPDGFVAITNEGMLLPVLPGRRAVDWSAVRSAFDGHTVIGICGETAAADAMRAGLNLGAAALQNEADEPHFALGLADLVVPRGDSQLTGVSDADVDILQKWRTTYHTETLATPASDAPMLAQADIARLRAEDRLRVLRSGDGTPIAMTAFNADAGDIVQVGGVFTPPDGRRQGLARRAVALHLAEARENGAARATLFAASDMAARAYIAIGFRGIGRYRIGLFKNDNRIAA